VKERQCFPKFAGQTDTMASHAFQGSLRISLVSVPVKAFSASAAGSGKIAFNQLHEPCGRRIQYKKFCPIHGQITQDEIVSGYEFGKDRYVVIDTDELEKLRTEKDRSIDIDRFVPISQVDPLYLDGRNYYLIPDGAGGQKPYQLIQHAMAAAKICGIAQVVISRREELVMVRPEGRLLVMTQLKYASELKSPESFAGELAEVKGTKQEQDLTAQLIKALTENTFNLSDYHDVYEERLKELIDAKVQGQELTPVEETSRGETHVINLMDAIRKSMKQVKQPKAGKRETHRPLPSAARRKKSG
jgi:DNA end-binding protein Ku